MFLSLALTSLLRTFLVFLKLKQAFGISVCGSVLIVFLSSLVSRSGEYSNISKVSYGQSRWFCFRISCLFSKVTVACALVIRLAG